MERIADYEERFGLTIDRKQRPVMERVRLGQPYPGMKDEDIRAAMSETFDEPIILEEGQWRQPAGAFGESCGPI